MSSKAPDSKLLTKPGAGNSGYSKHVPVETTSTPVAPSGPAAGPTTAICPNLDPKHVLKILVSSGAALAGYPVKVDNINQLEDRLVQIKANSTYANFHKIEVSIAGGTHEMNEPINLAANNAPLCGISIQAQSTALVTLKPRGELKNWSRFEGDIMRTLVPAGVDVTSLSMSGKLLLKSRFPSRNVTTGLGKIANIDNDESVFTLKNHATTRRLEKAFATAQDQNLGDPQLWVPGNGSLYVFDIVRIRETGTNVEAILGKSDPTSIGMKCLEAGAAKKLNDSERKRCRHDRANSNNANTQIWRPIKVNQSFYLENHVEFISAAGEWAFDLKTRALYLKLPAGTTLAELNQTGVNFTGNLASHNRMQTLISVNGLESFSMRGIQLEGTPFVHQAPVFAMTRDATNTKQIDWVPALKRFNKKELPAALEISNTKKVELTRNTFAGLNSIGLNILRSPSVKVELNRFQEIGFSAFDVQGNAAVQNSIISNNVFVRIGLRGVGATSGTNGVKLMFNYVDQETSDGVMDDQEFELLYNSEMNTLAEGEDLEVIVPENFTEISTEERPAELVNQS